MPALFFHLFTYRRPAMFLFKQMHIRLYQTKTVVDSEIRKTSLHLCRYAPSVSVRCRSLLTSTSKRFHQITKRHFATRMLYVHPGMFNKLKQCLFSIKSGYRKFATKQNLPFEPEIVSKDTLLYSYTNDKFFRLLTFFGIAQFCFWTYLSTFTLSLRDVPPLKPEQNRGQMPAIWQRVNLGDATFRYGLSILCLSFGVLLLFGSFVYPFRAVRNLTLLRGGQAVKVTTYAGFGRTRSFVVPLKNLSASTARTDSGHYVSLKIKDQWFYFLVDKRGEFHNVDLFDYNIGVMRNLK